MVSNNYSLGLPSATSPVSLLVPQALFSLLASRLKREKGGLRLYLSRLLHLAQCQTANLPSAPRVNTLYQLPGLDLVRMNVRLPSSLWIQLRSLARSRGVSICYLFTFLLKQDNKNKENVETPTLKKLQFREILDLVRKTLYRELKIDPATPG